MAGGDRCRRKSNAGGSSAIQSRAKAKQALPLPGNELERDPADKEIFKVQLMSGMTHWLNETKVRLENKNPRGKERGWWGCKRQRTRCNRRQPALLGAEGQSDGGGLDVTPGLPQICPRLGSRGLRRRPWMLSPARSRTFCSPNSPSPGQSMFIRWPEEMPLAREAKWPFLHLLCQPALLRRDRG